MKPSGLLRIYHTPSKQLLAAEKAGLLFHDLQQTFTGKAALNGSYSKAVSDERLLPPIAGRPNFSATLIPGTMQAHCVPPVQRTLILEG